MEYRQPSYVDYQLEYLKDGAGTDYPVDIDGLLFRLAGEDTDTLLLEASESWQSTDAAQRFDSFLRVG